MVAFKRNVCYISSDGSPAGFRTVLVEFLFRQPVEISGNESGMVMEFFLVKTGFKRWTQK